MVHFAVFAMLITALLVTTALAAEFAPVNDQQLDGSVDAATGENVVVDDATDSSSGVDSDEGGPEETLESRLLRARDQMIQDTVSANLIARLMASATPELPVFETFGADEASATTAEEEQEKAYVVMVSLEGISVNAAVRAQRVFYLVDDALCLDLLNMSEEQCTALAMEPAGNGFFSALHVVQETEDGQIEELDLYGATRAGLIVLASHAGRNSPAAHQLLHKVAQSGSNTFNALERSVLLQMPRASSYTGLDESLMIGEPALSDEEQAEQTAMLNSLRMPFNETLMREYYGVAADVEFPITPQRFKASELTQESFEFFVKRGQPIVVSLPEEWAPMNNWTCEHFRTEYADQEVSGWGNYGGDTERSKLTMKIGDAELLKIVESLGTEEERKETGSATVMSWFWWPIGADKEGTDVEDPVPQRLIQAFKKLPHFFRQTDLNQQVLTGRMEQFFGIKDSGARPHVDEVCDTIISVQTGGSKYWRLALTPDVAELERLNPGYQWQEWHQEALGIRQIDKHPLFAVDLQAGEMLVFPPGLVHGTKVTKSCSVSTSLQLGEPLPSGFYEAFYERLNNNPTVSSCFVGSWNNAIFGGRTYPIRAARNTLFLIYDFDKDGRLSAQELDAAFPATEEPEDRSSAELQAFVLMYDADKDGSVSEEEFTTRNNALFNEGVQENNRLHGLHRHMKAFFNRLDLDESGVIEKEEWNLLGSPISWEDVSQVTGGEGLLMEHLQDGLLQYVIGYSHNDAERRFQWDNL